MPRLMIVLGSVREGRVGAPIAEWVRSAAEADERFEVDFVDLAELQLPFMDEPNPPRLQQYTRPHTIAWSERVSAADGFIMLTPEYNHSYSPPLANAIDYLANEWFRKPIGFVNWGGGSSGTRAQVALRPVVAALGMVIARASVDISMPRAHMSDDDVFEPSELQNSQLRAQLDDIAALSEALKPLRG